MHKVPSVAAWAMAVVLGHVATGQSIPHSTTQSARPPRFQSGDYYLIADNSILRVAINAGFQEVVFSFPPGTTGAGMAQCHDAARRRLLFSIQGPAVTSQGVVIPTGGATLTLDASGIQRPLLNALHQVVAPYRCYASTGDGIVYCANNRIMILRSANDVDPLLDENGADTLPFFYCDWLFYYDSASTLFAASHDPSTDSILLSKFPLSADGARLREPMTFEYPLNIQAPGSSPFGGISAGPNGSLFVSADVGGACPSSACCTEKFNLVDPTTLNRSVFTLALPPGSPFDTYTTGYASVYDPVRQQIAAAYSTATTACLGCDWLAFYGYDALGCDFPDALFDMGGPDVWHAAPHHLIRIP